MICLFQLLQPDGTMMTHGRKFGASSFETQIATCTLDVRGDVGLLQFLYTSGGLYRYIYIYLY